MIIVIRDKESTSSILSIARKVDADCLEFHYFEKNNDELIALDPALIVLEHRLALLHCQELCDRVEQRKFRILVLLSEEQGVSGSVGARVSGADSCLLRPVTDDELRHAVSNECAARQRLLRGYELVEAGTTIGGRYKLKSVLGVGLRGTVYLADDCLNHCEVTVKVLRRMLALQPEIIGQFFAYADKLKGVTSEHLAEVIDYGTWQELPYIVFNMTASQNLYRVMALRKLTEADIVQLALCVTRALIAMKHFRLLHFNVKPENIFFHNGGFVLAEFGMVIPSNAPLDNFGFPYWSDIAFASHEFFCEDATMTARSDIYSLGALLCTVASRKNPFAGLQFGIVGALHQQGKQFSSAECDPPLSPALAITLDAMTQPRPSTRPRLRDLEIIFHQQITIQTGKRPAEEVGVSKLTVPASETEGGKKELELVHNRVENVSRPPTPGKRPAIPPPAALEKADTKTDILRLKSGGKSLRWIIGGIALSLVVLVLCAGMLWGYSMKKEENFKRGQLMMFACFSGHIHSDRTLDFGNVRCRTCHDWASPAYTCAKCRKIFGISLWPRRDMTEKECMEFEKKLFRCPYCRSGYIFPTPVSAAEKKLRRAMIGK